MGNASLGKSKLCHALHWGSGGDLPEDRPPKGRKRVESRKRGGQNAPEIDLKAPLAKTDPKPGIYGSWVGD